MWVQKTECQEIVRRCWGGQGFRGPVGVVDDIKGCGEALPDWHEARFGDLPK